jgi:hypothetical protein
MEREFAAAWADGLACGVVGELSAVSIQRSAKSERQKQKIKDKR